MTIKIVVAEDHTITRQGILSMLNQRSDMEVVGQAENGRQAVQIAAKLNPDVMIMDVMLPEMNGIEATRKITSANGKTKVIALSMHSDKRLVRRMLHSGASGYILKDCALNELVRGIQSVAQGLAYLSPKITDVLVNDLTNSQDNEDSTLYSDLTNRERETLQLIVEGRSTKKIAHQMYISIKTVESHRRQIMQKLNIDNIAQLTKYAISEGLTSLDQ